MNTVIGRQNLLEIVTEQAELDQPFEVNTPISEIMNEKRSETSQSV